MNVNLMKNQFEFLYQIIKILYFFVPLKPNKIEINLTNKINLYLIIEVKNNLLQRNYGL